jgi:protein TonB
MRQILRPCLLLFFVASCIAQDQAATPPPTDSTPPSQPAIVASGVIAGRKIGGNAPIYPPEAKRQRVQGTVLLNAVISEEGKIQDLKVAKAPDRDLADAAIQAVRSWRYVPYLLSGKPVKVRTTIAVNFVLSP